MQAAGQWERKEGSFRETVDVDCSSKFLGGWHEGHWRIGPSHQRGKFSWQPEDRLECVLVLLPRIMSID